MLLKALCAHFSRSERCLPKLDVWIQVSHLRVYHLLFCLYSTTLLHQSDSFYLLLYPSWALMTPLTLLNLNLTAGSRDLQGFSAFCLNHPSYRAFTQNMFTLLIASELWILRYSRTPAEVIRRGERLPTFWVSKHHQHLPGDAILSRGHLWIKISV